MRFIPILLSSCLTLPVWAEYRTPEELIATARIALAENNITDSAHDQRATRAESVDGMQILYELAELAVVGYPEGGFGVIAKNTEHETLWGYSSAPFDVNNPAPSFLALIANINDCMAQGGGRSSRSSIRRAMGDEDVPVRVDPFIKTQWNQRAPYNSLTPIIAGEHCLTGCSATALAQVVNYYKLPAQFSGTGSSQIYDWELDINERFTEDLANITWDFDQMVSNYEKQDYTESQSRSVAGLMYACGMLLHVAYGLAGTAGSLDESTLEKINYKTKRKGSLRDLADGLPILYRAEDHAMIIDGYDENGFLHINFGWGGREDGYYAMDDSEFKYHYQYDYGYIPGKVVAYIDKANAENGEYFFNPHTHKAFLDKPLKKDKEHLCVTDVFVPSSIIIDAEDYDVEYAEMMNIYNGTDATSFTFDEGITFVPSYFVPESAKEVYLPSTLLRVYSNGLNCTSLEHIYCAAVEPPVMEQNSLDALPSIAKFQKLTLHVPAESVEAYRQAEGWKKIYNIVALDSSSGVEEVSTDSSAFCVKDHNFTFTATDEPLFVRIITPAGNIVHTFNLAPYSAQSVPLDALAAGIYIIGINQQNFKVKVEHR